MIVINQVGSYKDGYHEYSERDLYFSPISDLFKPPYAFTRWLPYGFTKWSHVGYTGMFSRSSSLLPPHTKFSDWDLGQTSSNFTASFPSNLDMLSKLVDKWKDSDVNVGVSLGEGRESVSMIADNLFALAQSARQIKRGNLGAAVRHFTHPVPRRSRRKAAKALSQGDVSAAWLSLNLGWAPMIQDIYNASQFVKDAGSYGKISSPWVKGVATARVESLLGGKVSRAECRSRYVTVIRTPPTIYDRLGLTNPAVIAWELVPLSFVVDYFLPIGDFVNALSVFRMDYAGAQTFKEARVDIITRYPARAKGERIGSTWYAVTALKPTRHRYRTYSRTKVSLGREFVAGTFSVSVPSSLKRLSNMAALLHQSLLKLRK